MIVLSSPQSQNVTKNEIQMPVSRLFNNFSSDEGTKLYEARKMILETPEKYENMFLKRTNNKVFKVEDERPFFYILTDCSSFNIGNTNFYPTFSAGYDNREFEYYSKLCKHALDDFRSGCSYEYFSKVLKFLRPLVIKNANGTGNKDTLVKFAEKHLKEFVVDLLNGTLKALSPIYLEKVKNQTYEKFYEDYLKKQKSGETLDYEYTFMYDFFKPEHVAFINAVVDVLHDLSDSESCSYYVLSPVRFTNHLVRSLSPISVIIGAYHKQIENLKKEKESAECAPTDLVFISFTGIYNELEIEVILKSSEDIHLIIIYDEQTGPTLCSLAASENLFSEVICKGINSGRLILIPIPSLEYAEKILYPRDIYKIFELFVFRHIENITNKIVILSHSFNFEDSTTHSNFLFGNSNKKYLIDGYYYSLILQKISNYLQNKMIIIPTYYFIMPEANFKLAHNFMAENKLPDLPSEYIKFNVSSLNLATQPTVSSIKKSIILSLEVLTNYRRPNLKKKRLFENSQVNPVIYEIQKRLRRFYKDSHYHCNYGLMKNYADQRTKLEQNQAINFSKLIKYQFVSSLSLLNISFDLPFNQVIPAFDSSNKVRYFYLSQINTNQYRFYLDDKSKYQISYRSRSNPEVIIINAFCLENNKSFYKNIRIVLGEQSTEEFNCLAVDFIPERTLYNKFPPTTNDTIIIDFGLHVTQKYIFLCYGNRINYETNSIIAPSTCIYCFEKKENVWKILEYKYSKFSAYPRKNPSVVFFELDNLSYLAVAGGQKIHSEDFIDYDVCNHVEVIVSKNFSKTEFEYHLMKKSRDKEYPFVLSNSSNGFCYYHGSKIILFGGKSPEESMADWCMNYYEIQVAKKVDEWVVVKRKCFESFIEVKEEFADLNNFWQSVGAIYSRDQNFFFNDGKFRIICNPHRQGFLETTFKPECGPNEKNLVSSPFIKRPVKDSKRKIGKMELDFAWKNLYISPKFFEKQDKDSKSSIPKLTPEFYFQRKTLNIRELRYKNLSLKEKKIRENREKILNQEKFSSNDQAGLDYISPETMYSKNPFNSNSTRYSSRLSNRTPSQCFLNNILSKSQMPGLSMASLFQTSSFSRRRITPYSNSRLSYSNLSHSFPSSSLSSRNSINSTADSTKSLPMNFIESSSKSSSEIYEHVHYVKMIKNNEEAKIDKVIPTVPSSTISSTYPQISATISSNEFKTNYERILSEQDPELEYSIFFDEESNSIQFLKNTLDSCFSMEISVRLDPNSLQGQIQTQTQTQAQPQAQAQRKDMTDSSQIDSNAAIMLRVSENSISFNKGLILIFIDKSYENLCDAKKYDLIKNKVFYLDLKKFFVRFEENMAKSDQDSRNILMLKKAFEFSNLNETRSSTNFMIKYKHYMIGGIKADENASYQSSVLKKLMTMSFNKSFQPTFENSSFELDEGGKDFISAHDDKFIYIAKRNLPANIYVRNHECAKITTIDLKNKPDILILYSKSNKQKERSQIDESQNFYALEFFWRESSAKFELKINQYSINVRNKKIKIRDVKYNIEFLRKDSKKEKIQEELKFNGDEIFEMTRSLSEEKNSIEFIQKRNGSLYFYKICLKT